MSVSLSANETLPGDGVVLRVRGDKGSCVCVAAVDKSLYLLKPDFQLTPDKVGSAGCCILNSIRCFFIIPLPLLCLCVSPPPPSDF